MTKLLFTIIVAVAALVTLGCSPVETQARDSAAALSGSTRGRSNEVPNQLHGGPVAADLPSDQSRRVRRERSYHRNRNLLRMGGDAGFPRIPMPSACR